MPTPPATALASNITTASAPATTTTPLPDFNRRKATPYLPRNQELLMKLSNRTRGRSSKRTWNVIEAERVTRTGYGDAWSERIILAERLEPLHPNSGIFEWTVDGVIRHVCYKKAFQKVTSNTRIGDCAYQDCGAIQIVSQVPFEVKNKLGKGFTVGGVTFKS